MYEISTDKVCVGMPNNEEETRAKKCENQRDRYAALPSDEEEEVWGKNVSINVVIGLVRRPRLMHPN